VYLIINGDIPLDTNITINLIDVKDVALGAYSAMQKGYDRHRYIFANEKHFSMLESVKIAAEQLPELKLKNR
jgi:dihydroflavonol-4-reductase